MRGGLWYRLPDVVARLARVLRLLCPVLRSVGRVQLPCVGLPQIESLTVVPRLRWIPVAMIRHLILRCLRSAWRRGLMCGLRSLGWRPGENLRIRRRVRWRGIDAWPQGLKQRVRHLLDRTFTAASRQGLLGLD